MTVRSRWSLAGSPPRRRAAAAALVWTALLGCSHGARPGGGAPREVLNSERIAARFGSYGVDVLAADEELRVASLYSLEDGLRVCRTFAVTLFAEPLDPRLADAHHDIVAGGSIGATLRAHGWTVEKRHLYVGELAPDAALAAVYERMEITPAPLAVDVYRLNAARDSSAIPYATLAELHHPQYLGAADLRALLASSADLAAPSPEVERFLRRVAAAARRLQTAARSVAGEGARGDGGS